MANILCITSGLTGMLNASLALMKQLQKVRHTVTYGAIKEVGYRVTQEGIEYVQLPAYEEDPESFKTRPGILSHTKRVFTNALQFGRKRRERLKALNMEVFQQILEQKQPDIVLVDLELHPYIFTIYSRNIPFLIISQWFSGIPSDDIPPLDTLYIPHSNHAKKNIQALWSKKKKRLNKHYWKGAISSMWNDDRNILLAYAKKVGFPRQYLECFGWPTPFTYHHLTILHLNLAEMEFPHQFPDNHHYTGIYVDENRTELVEEEVMSQLEQIFKLKDQYGKKLIYCSVSTMEGANHSALDRIIPIVERNKDWILVAGLGRQIGTNKIQIQAENIFLFNFIPQLQVLQHADCSINHGGIHTINECIHFKVPMLIFPGGRFDQNGCAARVVFHQIGLISDPSKDSSDQIEAKIRQIIYRPVEALDHMNQCAQNPEYDQAIHTIIEKTLDNFHK